MTLVNRFQATALDYRLLRVLKLLLLSSLPLSGLVLLGQIPGNRVLEGSGYWWLCRAWLGWLLVDWLLRRFSTHRRWREGAEKQQVFDLGEGDLDLSGLVIFCRRLPGNQVLQLEVNRKEMPLGSSAQGLAGLTITHLSDLHISGQMGKQFYESLCDQVNQLSSDLVCLSGDILDDDHCREWLPDTLGRLHARQGVYYVLGNHDARHADPGVLRQELAGCGLVDLAGRQHLLTHREGQLLLAGTEVPWLGTLQTLEDFPGQSPLSLLLSHSPDIIRWARRRRISLVLAGHLHGGQIRLPVIGPLVSPSFHGVRFSGGRFRCGNTLLHVSRGVGGMQPLRWNCRPELTQLRLTDNPLP